MKKQSKLKQVLLNKGLPLLANVLSGGTTGTALNLIGDLVGIKTKQPNDLADLIESNPEIAIKLKELELNQKTELEKLALQAIQLDLENTKAHLQNQADARHRELELAKAGQKEWIMKTLALTVVISLLVLIALGIIHADILYASPTLNQLFGALVAGFSMVLSYYFGSSEGSAKKNITIKEHIARNN
nr:hypothetical protein [uncultured Carboxylicivirga sp.]